MQFWVWLSLGMFVTATQLIQLTILRLSIVRWVCSNSAKLKQTVCADNSLPNSLMWTVSCTNNWLCVYQMLTLLRMITGEAWTDLMHDCMIQPPKCTVVTSDPKPLTSSLLLDRLHCLRRFVSFYTELRYPAPESCTVAHSYCFWVEHSHGGWCHSFTYSCAAVSMSAMCLMMSVRADWVFL